MKLPLFQTWSYGVRMTEAGGVQKNTAYGVFVQACWAQHKRQYPDELIHKEIEEFNKQCSVWWYNLSEQERDRFQEMADRSNAQQAALNQAYTAQVQTQNNIVTTVQTSAAGGQQPTDASAIVIGPQLMSLQHRLCSRASA